MEPTKTFTAVCTAPGGRRRWRRLGAVACFDNLTQSTQLAERCYSIEFVKLSRGYGGQAGRLPWPSFLVVNLRVDLEPGRRLASGGTLALGRGQGAAVAGRRQRRDRRLRLFR